jgi:phage gpG-like protein
MYKSYSKEVKKSLSDARKVSLDLIGEVARASVVDVITEKGIVDTGRLRASIDHFNNGVDTVTIGTPVEYAITQELGNSRQKGRPYLKTGVYRIADKIQSIVSKVFKEVLK